MRAALSVLGALTLIALALFVGGLILRGVPSSWVLLVGIVVVMGIGIPALIVDENRAPSASAGGGGASAGGTTTTAGGGGATGGGGGGKPAGGGGGGLAAQGKLIFTQTCGTCHTLADAGTQGQVGPVLDQIKPDKQRVLNAIKNGGLGSGTMPTNLVTGKEAQAVATYVSSVAGK